VPRTSPAKVTTPPRSGPDTAATTSASESGSPVTRNRPEPPDTGGITATSAPSGTASPSAAKDWSTAMRQRGRMGASAGWRPASAPRKAATVPPPPGKDSSSRPAASRATAK